MQKTNDEVWIGITFVVCPNHCGETMQRYKVSCKKKNALTNKLVHEFLLLPNLNWRLNKLELEPLPRELSQIPTIVLAYGMSVACTIESVMLMSFP